MVPHIDARALTARKSSALSATKTGAEDVGFLTLHNTPVAPDQVLRTIDAYRAFFKAGRDAKQMVNMNVTGSNRGWGGGGSEQVDPTANPDYKEVFDCGVELPAGDPLAHLSVYAPNQWPQEPVGFQNVIEDYFTQARTIAMDLLQGISAAIGADPTFFRDKFTKPMALLRGQLLSRTARLGGRQRLWRCPAHGLRLPYLAGDGWSTGP